MPVRNVAYDSVMAWLDTYSTLASHCEMVKPFTLFRGQRDARWPLLPAMARHPGAGQADFRSVERIFYFEYVTRAGSLLPDVHDPWEIVFAMQHHGLPTRLLDWSETLSVALYFALAGAVGDAAVWVLNPFTLNQELAGRREIVHARDLPENYYDYFIAHNRQPPGVAMALWPLHRDPRLLRQRGAFTMHADLTSPLESLCSLAITKVVIPKSEHADAWRFLRMAGISEFSLFPDLDGLSRELRSHIWPV
jgi:hypothetical protein